MPERARTGFDVEIRSGMVVSLDVQPKNNMNGRKNILTLSSIVEELFEDGSLLIHMPIQQGSRYLLSWDELILMKFFVDSKLYSVMVQFEERLDRNALPFARVRRIGKIEPHQQRDCHRLPLSLPVKVRRLSQNGSEKRPGHPVVEGHMINFSDGGMLLAVNENIQKDELVSLTFDLDSIETVKGLALRTEKVERGKYLLKVAFQFQDPQNDQKRRFYKYIVDKQLEERRRWNR